MSSIPHVNSWPSSFGTSLNSKSSKIDLFFSLMPEWPKRCKALLYRALLATTCWLLAAAEGLAGIGPWSIGFRCLVITPCEPARSTLSILLLSPSLVSAQLFIYLFCLLIRKWSCPVAIILSNYQLRFCCLLSLLTSYICNFQLVNCLSCNLLNVKWV